MNSASMLPTEVAPNESCHHVEHSRYKPRKHGATDRRTVQIEPAVTVYRNAGNIKMPGNVENK